MQNRRHDDDFAMLPLLVGVTRGNPHATLKLRILVGVRILFRWTIDKKEPGIESSRRKWGSHPATNESEIVCVEVQAVMLEQLRPRHSLGFEIVEERGTLTNCQRF